MSMVCKSATSCQFHVYSIRTDTSRRRRDRGCGCSLSVDETHEIATIQHELIGSWTYAAVLLGPITYCARALRPAHPFVRLRASPASSGSCPRDTHTRK